MMGWPDLYDDNGSAEDAVASMCQRASPSNLLLIS